MICLVGDIHYDPLHPVAGRTAGPSDDAALAACLRSIEDRVTAVVLLGDIFDAYVEYRHLVPKGPVRTLGLLASWTLRGVPVHVAVGNHDPWHRDWFEKELGFSIHRSATTLALGGTRLHIAHGDAEEYGSMRFKDRVLRARWAHRLWTAVLPGDLGQGLAARVSRGMRRHELESRTVEALRTAAARALADGADVVAFGHSHVAERLALAGGTYVNPGLWPLTRTLGVIERGETRLVRWNGSAFEAVAG